MVCKLNSQNENIDGEGSDGTRDDVGNDYDEVGGDKTISDGVNDAENDGKVEIVHVNDGVDADDDNEMPIYMAIYMSIWW